MTVLLKKHLEISTPLAYNSFIMQFIETSIFTRQVTSLLADEEYSQLQLALSTRPDMGVIIPHSGGLRKVRWSISDRGKRGGVRVIYYWVVVQDQILMLFIYPKSERDDLTPQQLKILREIVEKEYK
jgi:mRNA-degrading endonuclease RelE of RelBE toxin-antitoxin system